MKQILPENMPPNLAPAQYGLNILNEQYPNFQAPTGEAQMQQKAWDNAVSTSEFNNLLNSAHQIEAARLHAAASPHSGAWLHALPLAKLGLYLNDNCIQVGVALRLGAEICQEHKCRCGRMVDRLGLF